MKTRRTFLRGMLFAGAVTGLPVGWPQEFPRKPQPIWEAAPREQTVEVAPAYPTYRDAS